MIARSINAFRLKARKKRARVFRHLLYPSANDRILDLGGGSGSHIANIVPYRDNVYLADIDEGSLLEGNERFGFKTVLIGENGRLPFPDNCFDIVFCSSVIEHATISKEEVRKMKSDQEFFNAAYQRQRQFANDIQRVGKRYFVQTPYKYFAIESHTWMPVVFVLLPRAWQIRIIDYLKSWWPKKTSPDWNLLTKRQLQELFPGAQIASEKVFGLTKSIMAIKNLDHQNHEAMTKR